MAEEIRLLRQQLDESFYSLEQSAGGGGCIRFPITKSPFQNSVSWVPEGSLVIQTVVDIVTPFSNGTQISVGRQSDPDILMEADANAPTVPGLYTSDDDIVWGAPSRVLITVTGSPSVGSGFCLISFAMPTG